MAGDVNCPGIFEQMLTDYPLEPMPGLEIFARPDLGCWTIVTTTRESLFHPRESVFHPNESQWAVYESIAKHLLAASSALPVPEGQDAPRESR